MQTRAIQEVPQRLSQAEADAICARHERLWRARPGGARGVFAWMDLSGLDFSGRNLTDTDFSGAIAVGCNLSGAKLDNANLFGADLREADLSNASLRRADLRGACLRGANLSGADLFEADLREGALATADARTGYRVLKPDGRPSDAQGVSLVGANLERSRLTGIIAVRADFTDAIMRDCKLVRANLKQATFNGADLAGSDLSGADLSGADLTDAVLVGIKTEAWRTDGADAFFLDGAQQLHLHGKRKFGHFIQKQGAAVGRLKQAFLVRKCAREAPLFMAEELAFHQLAGDGAAIDRHKRAGTAWA